MKKIILFLFLPLILYSQKSIENKFQRDTSFTLRSETIKVQKQFPQAVPVAFQLQKGIRIYENEVYHSEESRNLHVDIFMHESRDNKKKPVVIIIHGGGWRTGDKKMEWPKAQYLAQNNFIAATVEYRLSPEAKYPAAIFDLKEAVKWLKVNSQKFNIDTNKIAVYGCSAGGQLAAFLGVTGNNKKFENPKSLLRASSIVHAVIDVDGILDFTHPAESNKDSNSKKPSAGKAWFGASYDENPQPWIEASPINYINKNSCPFLFINSSNERFHAGRDYMLEKISVFNIYSEVHTIPDTPHTFWLFEPWFDKTMVVAKNFLNKIFN